MVKEAAGKETRTAKKELLLGDKLEVGDKQKIYWCSCSKE